MKPLPHPRESPWTIRSQRAIYRNPWIAVTEHDVLTPAQTSGIYGTVEFQTSAVGIIPVDAQGHTWLVGQYRFPLARYSWEIPEGGCPRGEAPLAAAQRELAEECGLVASGWRLLLQMDLSNSVTDETAAIFLATGLTDLGRLSPEETEALRLHRLPLSEAFARVRSGELRDSMTVGGLQRLELERLRHPGRPLSALGAPAPPGQLPAPAG
jgi:8-oxo-dGTP pyrophosphatase MutT (NUDIX family)